MQILVAKLVQLFLIQDAFVPQPVCLRIKSRLEMLC